MADSRTQSLENAPLLLEMRGIRKTFSGVCALHNVSFDLCPGEIHSLAGENGAGKSTLIKILAGFYPHSEFEGEIVIDGTKQRFKNIRDAERAGIAVVFQELSLVPEMTVGENIFLGREPSCFGVVQSQALYERAEKLLRELQLEIDPHALVARLGVGQQQLVEIVKAFSQSARILILDEPTAALTDAETENLLSVLMELRKRGVGIIYISHRLREVFRISDRITVLRDGSSIDTCVARAVDEQQVISMMVGREVNELFPERKAIHGEVVFEVRHVSVQDFAVEGKVIVEDVSFQVRQGEILGIAGLMGAGRTELLMALYGCYPGRMKGEILVAGRPVSVANPREAIANGIGFVSEDRKRYGLFPDKTVLHNMTLAALPRISGGFVTDESREVAASSPFQKTLGMKISSLFTIAGLLSGGNQQKMLLSRILLAEPKILFLDEPTRGIDIGAKAEIYSEIEKLVRSGLAVVMVSSELIEVLGLSDRIIVLHKGRVTGEFAREHATPEAVMACATGHSVRLSGSSA
jgi:D-xylose transport system ATP-binding protein